MKFIILLFSLTFLLNEPPYPCHSYEIFVWPYYKNEISINSKFIINGLTDSQSTIKLLNKNYPIYLESKRQKVKLTVVEIHEGKYDITQAVLRPEEELIKGETYTLHIENLNKSEEECLTRWDSYTKTMKPKTWFVTIDKDTTEPIWDHKPRFKEQQINHFMAGIEVWSIFKFGVVEQTPMTVETELHDITTNEKVIQYVPLRENGELHVGHNACNGAFLYFHNHEYEIRFRMMDSSGNKDRNWTEWISLENPLNK
jgi:hypothetical protein